MKKTIGLAGLIALLLACDNTPAPNTGLNTVRSLTAATAPEQTFRGMYRSGSAGVTFYDCASQAVYRVGQQPDGLDSLYREACHPAPCPNESVYAVIRGRLEPAAPDTTRRLQIVAVDTIRPKSMFDKCMPFDFWCVGTEPFWGLYISEKDGGFYLKNMGADHGLNFPWSPPVKTATTWTYRSTHPQTGETLRVVVRREPCSDGMSERAYDYSVDMTLGQQQFHGCATK